MGLLVERQARQPAGMAQPTIALYVRPVEGRVVPRYGTSQLLGAERLPVTKASKRSGEPAIVWDTSTAIALTDDYCRRYTKELRQHIRNGDLIVATEEIQQ